MRPVHYEQAPDAASAVALAAGRAHAHYLGGGTNLVDLMKLGVTAPGLLVDVTRAGLNGLSETNGSLRIGAGVRNADVTAHPTVRAHYPALSAALLAGASGQLRNMATVGGNLMQRTRCRYFQDMASPCNKRSPGSGCPALDGEHHNLAILGASDSCVATHPSDMAVALTALDARIESTGPAGDRQIAIADFYRLPGDDPRRDTTLDDGELITAVTVPAPTGGRSTYRKVRERASFAFAVASVAAVLGLHPDGAVAEVRLALGAVAHKPWRATVAEEVLTGAPADADHFRMAIDAELQAAQPLRDNAFKIPLVRNLVVATLGDLANGAGAEVLP